MTEERRNDKDGQEDEWLYGMARPGKDWTAILSGGVKLEMVWVEPGTFMMGSEKQDDEKPLHKVTLTKGYWIGKYQFTQEQWKSVGASKRDSCNWSGDWLPVECVSWNEAVECCKKLSEQLADKLPSGYRFWLPSEAQWEFAARGGVKSRGYEYSGSDNIDEVAWYSDNSDEHTHEVGQKKPNELGIFDMSGNVWEWCHDWDGSYSSGPVTDPAEPSSGSCRVLRGGSWLHSASLSRSACRDCNFMSGRDYNLGFRVALVPVTEERWNEKENQKGEKRLHGLACLGEDWTAILPDGVELEMVWVEPGTFMMGSPEDELGRCLDETQHHVILTKPFWIGKYPVIWRQYNTMVNDHDLSPWYPVDQITWDEAMFFCQALNKILKDKLPVGYQFGLPTEAQWEYACRAGTTTALNNGHDLTSEFGYCEYLDSVGWFYHDDDVFMGIEVAGRLEPNAWNLYDMHGNVWEWCHDWYGPFSGDAIDPAGPASGTRRVLRGGGWYSNACHCRSAKRHKLAPSESDIDIGFRLAIIPIA